MSTQADTYNFRNYGSSPQKKSHTSSQLKTSSYRPNSAIRTKYDMDHTNQSPSRIDAKTGKKSSLTRHPTTSGSIRPTESRSTAYRRKNEDSNSLNSFSRNSNKLDRNLSIDVSGSQSNYSGVNLKGYSVTQTNGGLASRTVLPVTGPYSTKFSLYGTSSPASTASRTPTTSNSSGKITPLKKYGTLQNSTVNPVTTSSNERSYPSSLQKEERPLFNAGYIGYTAPSRPNNPYDNDDAIQLPQFEPTKCSVKQNGVIKAYAVNTHQGIVRNYNEDRVAIILNIMKPPHLDAKDEWPLCSFFGVYDGHGGTGCADFLRDNLHQFVIQDRNFPKNPVEALKRGFEEAEKAFKEYAQQPSRTEIDRSGSCAIVVLIVEDTCYVANVGDSRVVASFEQGRKAVSLSRDHKPNDRDEQKRITTYGGRVYQSQINQPPGFPGPKVILGPHRVFPGRLSVSRTFGDIEAKLIKYGGNPYVVIAEAEIKVYKINKDWDFLLLGCDGIYDKLETEDVVNCVWNSSFAKEADIHRQTAIAVEKVMKESLIQRSYDNITAVMVSFSGFENANFSTDSQDGQDKSARNRNQHSQKLGLDNFDYSPSVAGLPTAQYRPLSTKSVHRPNTDNPSYSSAGKRYETTNIPDYSAGSLGKIGTFWRGNN